MVIFYVYNFYTHGCDVFTCKNIFYTHWYHFYSHGCYVFTCKNVLYTRSLSSIPMGAMYLYMQECFLHSLIPLLFPWVWCIYVQECSVHSLIHLLFPWVQCIYTCNQEHFFTLADRILYRLQAPIFTMITKGWPCANQTVVPNNLTDNRSCVNWGFPVHIKSVK